MMIVNANVPCNGCTACCRNDLIFLHPECGDRAEDHEGNTMPATNPITGERGLALKHKPGGGCIYLVEGVGCSIHGRAPAVCREFDCRRVWLKFLELPRPERRRALREVRKRGLMSDAVIEAAKARLHTLRGEEAA